MNSTLRVIGVAVLVSTFVVAGAAEGENVFPILKGPYLGQEPPGMTPEVFAPGIISRDEYEMNSVFSPDGSEFFYVISTSTPEEKKRGHYYYVIMTSRIVDGVWSAPARLKVIGDSSATDIALAPDGRLYFCSDAPSPWNEPTALDLWYVERSAEGWSDPVNVGPRINTAESETQPSFTTQGKMYYPSVREDTRGGVDIYYAARGEDGYSNPVNVGAPVNTEFHEGNSFVAPDESYLLFARWGMPESIDGGKALYISFRMDDGGWTEPINTGPSAGLRGSLAALSPDERYLFFSSGGDIYWVDSRVIDVLRDQAFAQEGEKPQMTPEQQAEMEAYMKAGALGPQHELMAKHVGTYDVAMKRWGDPSAPPMESKGVAIRTLQMGGRIMHEEFQADVMGMPFTGLSRSGYDNVSGKSWSTWTDSMTTGIMISEGDCDENYNCTYIGTYNDPITGGPVTNRYVAKWTSPDEQYFSMYGPGRDGNEVKMMEMIYTRR